MRNTRGFTLLELLMVVIIIAILASIALPQYVRTAERARAAEALQVLAAIRTSELRYKAFSPTGVYNDLLAELDIDIPGVTAPDSLNWDYLNLTGTGPGTNVVADRLGGTFIGEEIQLDLDTGQSCSTVPVYGLPTSAC